MAALVHHGGPGTTAAGLRAAKPTIICPSLGTSRFGEAAAILWELAPATHSPEKTHSREPFPSNPNRPEFSVILLEPSTKKRAFLNEVVRQCNLVDVQITGQRMEEFSGGGARRNVDIVTARGLRHREEIAAMSNKLLVSSGKLCLWLTRSDAEDVARRVGSFRWKSPIGLPLTRERVILVGEKENQD